MEGKNKILVIMTGGTVCSVKSEDGKSRSNVSATKSYLTEHYRESNSPFAREASFIYRSLFPDVLSENMNGSVLCELLDVFKKEENLTTEYAGVIILHGTDTLAYTSAFLSFALAGLSLPVMMVSSQLPLQTEEGESEARANGYANFRAATELILNGILPNVYVPYENMPKKEGAEGALLLHLGAHLLQCPNASDDFHSRDEMEIPDRKNACLAGVSFESAPLYYLSAKKAEKDILLLPPYTNLNYSLFDISRCAAVVHGSYHSESVCIGRPSSDKAAESVYSLEMIREEDRRYSVLYLLKECQAAGIPLFLAPCRPESYRYATTQNALSCGACPLGNMTRESAYAKALLGAMLGKEREALTVFMKKSINHEQSANAQNL